MEQWTNLLASPIIIVLALVIGTLGEVSKRMIKAKAGDKGWRGVYFVTLPAHPVIVGALIGLVPWLPTPDELAKPGHEFASRLGTGLLAGMVCKVGYDGIVSTLKRSLGQATARGSDE
jgi:H+/Cl- antiporter ClcA